MKSKDIMNEIIATLAGLKEGRITVDEGNTRARLLRAQLKLVGLELKHALHTRRLQQNSPALPGFERE